MTSKAFVIIGAAVLALACRTVDPQSGASWNEYRYVNLPDLLLENRTLHAARPGIYFTLPRKILMRARGLPVTRPLSNEVQEFFESWEHHWSPKQDLPASFSRLAFVTNGELVVWMPIQDSLVAPFEKIDPGQLLDLYVMWLGIAANGESVFAINAFRELPPDEEPLVTE